MVERFAKPVWRLALANLLVFFVVGQLIGGYAILGFTSGDHHVLGLMLRPSPRRFDPNGYEFHTEVSKAVWDYSYWHTWSVLASLPIAGVLLWLKRHLSKATQEH